ncbi:hypothetical protein [Streptodolium elevatio]|uniref:Secreted protein n=1 Tax=Streptodolium elevatio TaxID=3157996 RepID=A0ABV3DDZ3_9ACTN
MRSKWTSVALATALSVSAVGVGAGAATAFVDDRPQTRVAPAVPAAPDPTQLIGQVGDLGAVLKTVSGLTSAASAEKPDADVLGDRLELLTTQVDKLLKSLGGGAVPPVVPDTGSVVPDTGSVVPNTGTVAPDTGGVVPNTGGVLPGAVQAGTGKALPVPAVSLEDALASLKKNAEALVAAATKVPPNLDGVKTALTALATDIVNVLTAAVTKIAPPV